MAKGNVIKEPLVRVVKRDTRSTAKTYKFVLIRVAAVILALIVDALFIFFITGLNPISVYTTMFKGTFDFEYGSTLFTAKFLTTVRDMALLLGIAVALAPAFKMRFWNIGAEGQVLMGALATACVMQYGVKYVSGPVLMIIMFVMAVIAGAVWGILPAIFKAKWKTNETLFTLMMNYIAINIISFATNVWRGKKSTLGTINSISREGWFPKILNQDFTLGIIMVFALVVLVFIYLKYSKHGYEISVVGESENTAKYAGINIKKVIIRTMAISGAICGLCGFMVVAGKDHTVSTGSAGGYGFTAIIVAWMAKFNTFFMMLIAFLIAFLEHGASEIHSTYAVINDYAADIISAVILFFLIGCEFFINYRLVFRSGRKKEA